MLQAIVCPSVSRSTRCNNKMEIGTWLDRLQSQREAGWKRLNASYHVYLHGKADPDDSILWSQILLRKTSVVWKIWYFAVYQHHCLHPMARMLHYLSICWASCLCSLCMLLHLVWCDQLPSFVVLYCFKLVLFCSVFAFCVNLLLFILHSLNCASTFVIASKYFLLTYCNDGVFSI